MAKVFDVTADNGIRGASQATFGSNAKALAGKTK